MQQFNDSRKGLCETAKYCRRIRYEKNYRLFIYITYLIMKKSLLFSAMAAVALVANSATPTVAHKITANVAGQPERSAKI